VFWQERNEQQKAFKTFTKTATQKKASDVDDIIFRSHAPKRQKIEESTPPPVNRRSVLPVCHMCR